MNYVLMFSVWLFLHVISCNVLASERYVSSPDGKIVVSLSDDDGLYYSVKIDGENILAKSILGLEFRNGVKLGKSAKITASETRIQDTTWENRFGNRREIRDHYNELSLDFEETGNQIRTFGLIIRVYNNGIAFRYDIPDSSGLKDFVMTNELTEFNFAEDYRCWAGNESACAENLYPEKRLSEISTGSPGTPFRSVLPLLVETAKGYVAVAESDLIDWSGMSLTGTGTSSVKVVLDSRSDGNGLVVSSTPRLSPWRVLIFAPKAVDLPGNNLVTILASPCRLEDSSWIKPGVCAWDSWWTGINPYDADPGHKAVYARGTTRSHKQYIDLASEMGWSYQLMDWFWYENMTSFNKSLHSAPNPAQGDFRKPVPDVNVEEILQYAKTKNVRLLIWAHSLDVRTFGIEEAFSYFSDLGFAGVKIDFLNSQSQETVQWCAEVLETAAKYKLLIDFHGVYKPTGLARTYPNYITQEGVLGNEYNKLGGKLCNPLHTVTLPFTRALLGPMDFTPGGFINRSPEDFRTTFPAEVMGSRARQLAMTVVYPSPLQVLCDSPQNYKGQPGLRFLSDLPTVWDDSIVLAGEVAKSIVVARKSEDKWYLAAMNGVEELNLDVGLNFLGKGKWVIKSYSDNMISENYQDVAESSFFVNAEAEIEISMMPAGGFAGVIEKVE